MMNEHAKIPDELLKSKVVHLPYCRDMGAIVPHDLRPKGPVPRDLQLEAFRDLIDQYGTCTREALQEPDCFLKVAQVLHCLEQALVEYVSLDYDLMEPELRATQQFAHVMRLTLRRVFIRRALTGSKDQRAEALEVLKMLAQVDRDMNIDFQVVKDALANGTDILAGLRPKEISEEGLREVIAGISQT